LKKRKRRNDGSTITITLTKAQATSRARSILKKKNFILTIQFLNKARQTVARRTSQNSVVLLALLASCTHNKCLLWQLQMMNSHVLGVDLPTCEVNMHFAFSVATRCTSAAMKTMGTEWNSALAAEVMGK